MPKYAPIKMPYSVLGRIGVDKVYRRIILIEKLIPRTKDIEEITKLIEERNEIKRFLTLYEALEKPRKLAEETDIDDMQTLQLWL